MCSSDLGYDTRKEAKLFAANCKDEAAVSLDATQLCAGQKPCGNNRGTIMRLFYQTLGMSRGSKSGTYGQVLRRLIANAAAPGTTIDIFGLAPHRAVADQYRYLEFQDTVEVLENGLRAEREGYDAILLGNIFQPGLHELRRSEERRVGKEC